MNFEVSGNGSSAKTKAWNLTRRNSVTRAKKVFVLIGTKKAISMAVRNNKTSKRNTRLAERLSNECSC